MIPHTDTDWLVNLMMDSFHITHPDGAIVEYKDVKQVAEVIANKLASEELEARIDELESTLRVTEKYVSAAVYRDISQRIAALKKQKGNKKCM